MNPFEHKVAKSKFSVLNRQVVGTKGRPTQSRARSYEVRKKSLVPELARRGRTSEFIDRRFGERDGGMSSDEKMLARFSRERMRGSRKKAIFNLQDDHDAHGDDYRHTLTLTHRGKKIDDLDEFDSDPDVSDAESEGGLDSHLVRTSHFGGGEEDERRSKADIMQEVIAKSKMHKHERQRIKEENASLCESLDADFGSLLHALEARDADDQPRREHRQEPTPKDDYNEILKMITFDRRTRPADRTKTDEEIAHETATKRDQAQREKAQRMHGDLDPELDYDAGSDENQTTRTSSEETDAEKSLQRVMAQAERHLDDMLNATTLAAVNQAYREIAALSRTRSVIPVARVLREHLGEQVRRILRLRKKDSELTMPDRRTLMLFHLIGRLFSTSDFHHIVATPAQLLIAAYLDHGRITKRRHLLSALFLMQTILYYQRESKRYLPEMMGLLAPLLFKTFAVQSKGWSPYPTDRFMSKSVHDWLSTGMDQMDEPRGISFDDLVRAEEDDTDSYPTKEMLAGMLVKILQDAVQLYEAHPASPEMFLPLLEVLQSSSLLSSTVAELRALIEKRLAHRRPLMLQKFRRMAIPQLTPDLDEGLSREEREHKMLQKAYRRELKGAKRELKRDSAFLSRHKLETRLEADRKYQERLRQIMGSIANEGNTPDDNPKKRRH